MADEARQDAPSRPLKQVQQEQAADTSWKKDPEVGEDGHIYRINRVKNRDGSFTVFRVKVGKAPQFPPKGK